MWRLILIDDHAVVRRGLALVLNLENDFEVVGEAADGMQGLDLVDRVRPDIALVDLKMPVMAGRETAAAIKQAHPNVKVVILSGAEIDEDVYAAVEAGIDGYIMKDASPAAVANHLRKIARGERHIHPAVLQAMKKHLTAPAALPTPLTRRETEVLAELATSATYREIGLLLCISEETVRSHVKSILMKLDQPNRTMAVVTAIRLGLISLDN